MSERASPMIGDYDLLMFGLLFLSRVGSERASPMIGDYDLKRIAIDFA